MKINGSQSIDPSLIEQMQRAHKQAKTEGADNAQGASFSVEQTSGTPQTEQASKPDPSPGVSNVAKRVIDGEIKGPEQARKEVLVALVDERYSHMIEPSAKRKTLALLEDTLVNDPSFSKEVDRMLLLAARDLGSK